MSNYARPDQFTGVTLEQERFYILFEHQTGRGYAKKRILLRPEDVDGLRRALDAFAVLMQLGAPTSQPDEQ